jgi:hypothetical protein
MTSKAKKILPEEKKITSKAKRVADGGGPSSPSPSGASGALAERAKPAGGGLSLAKAKPRSASPKADRPRPPSIPPERGDGTSKAKEFRSMKPARNQATACRSCGWTGVLGDCAERGMGGDAFSEGWAWHCPHCKAVVEVYAWRQLELIATSS